MSDYADELDLDEVEDDPEIVRWMNPRPLSVGALGLSGAVAGAFVLGAATAVGVLALMHWIGPDRDPFARRRFWS